MIKVGTKGFKDDPSGDQGGGQGSALLPNKD